MKFRLSKQDQHALRLGWLVGNLQSIETLLRFYLLKVETPDASGPLEKIPGEGEYLPASSISDYRQLSALISAYNKTVGKESGLRLDPEIVRLRDAIAHGRTTKPSGYPNMFLFKFESDKGKTGRHLVSFSVEMTPQWFRDRNEFLLGEIEKVRTAVRSLGW